MPSLSSLRNVDTRKWVSGTTYGADTIVWSPVNYLMYVRTVAGSGTTDPSADSTNWALWGPTKLKSLQRGVITVNAGSFTGTATISAVNTAKARLRFLGGGPSVAWGNNATYGCRLSLSSATQVALEIPQALAGTYQASFEIDEDW